ncbi:MAG: PH domain-containing protein [Candidatus Altiarchaeota archaeon]
MINFLEFSSIRYELRNDGVFIKRGFLAPKESLVLYRNIQDVEETQNFMEMLLGIKTLLVKTMTTQSAVYSKLQYLHQDIAPVIREKILKLSQKISKEELSFEKEKEKFSMKQLAESESEVEASPYTNHFIKAAIYSYVIYIGSIFCLVEFILISLGIFIDPSVFLLTFFPLIISLFPLLLMLINAIILSFTYKYNILQNSIVIKYGLFNITKKQINYDKIQDLVIKVSFPQYLAKLASLKVDTGSREIVQDKYDESYRGFSMSTLAESIPYLDFFAAVNLRKRILDFMGLSLEGSWSKPLVSQFSLEEIKPVKKTLWWVIYSVVLSILAFLVTTYTKFSLNLFFFVLLIFLVAIIIKYIYEREYYKRYFYDMNDDLLIIRKGVFGKTEMIIPLSKIQDIFIDQDILDRIFNLRDLYVSTVTVRSILNAHIDGIAPEKAEKIALLLLEKINNKRKTTKSDFS